MAAELKSPSPRMAVRDHARVPDPVAAARVLVRAHDPDHARAIRALAPDPEAVLDKRTSKRSLKTQNHTPTRSYSMWINRSNLHLYHRLAYIHLPISVF